MTARRGAPNPQLGDSAYPAEVAGIPLPGEPASCTTTPHEGATEADAVPTSERKRSPRPPSRKQRALFAVLLKAKEWTPEERARLTEWAATKATMKTMSWKLDWAKVEIFRRGGGKRAPTIYEL